MEENKAPPTTRNLSVRRSPLEIMIEILIQSETPNLKTKLMYATNLSWKPMTVMMDKLIKNDLLEVVLPPNLNQKNCPEKRYDRRTRVRVVTTAKGIKLLKTLKPAMKILKDV
jgi:hypothetical protein